MSIKTGFASSVLQYVKLIALESITRYNSVTPFRCIICINGSVGVWYSFVSQRGQINRKSVTGEEKHEFLSMTTDRVLIIVHEETSLSSSYLQ